MKLRSFSSITVACLVFLAAILSATPGKIHGNDKQPVKIAILPCSDVVKSFERFKPLTDYLEQETGLEIQAKFPKEFTELKYLIKSNSIDFVFISPFDYLKISDLVDENSLLKTLTVEGRDFQTGVLVVLHKSNIRNFEDLRGKVVHFGMLCSAGRWAASRKVFMDNGIDIDKDLAGYVDGGCCEDISYNIYLGAAQAGMICKHYLEEQKHLKAKHVEDMIVIGETDPIPTRVFGARRGTAPEVAAAIRKALLAINIKDTARFKDLIKTSEIGGFSKAAREDYGSL